MDSCRRTPEAARRLPPAPEDGWDPAHRWRAEATARRAGTRERASLDLDHGCASLESMDSMVPVCAAMRGPPLTPTGAPRCARSDVRELPARRPECQAGVRQWTPDVPP